MAEQLICLRNDLDKSHAENLKIQRQQNHSFESLNVSRRSEADVVDTGRVLECPMPLSVQPKPIVMSRRAAEKDKPPKTSSKKM